MKSQDVLDASGKSKTEAIYAVYMDKSETEQVLSSDKDINLERDDYEDEMYEEFDEDKDKKDSMFD